MMSIIAMSENLCAQTTRYEVQPSDKSYISFKLPYTLGTHEAEVNGVQGEFILDLAKPELGSGHLRIPIQEIKSGNDQRDCHMQEAMGLDYTKSIYPNEHVCDEKNKIPHEGKNAITYPYVEFKIKRVHSLEKSGVIPTDRENFIEVKGEWFIHGVRKSARFPIKLVPQSKGFRAQGQYSFNLKNFGIEVKPAYFLFFKITVSDKILVTFDILCE